MSWQRPSPRIVWRAIEIYLEIAYSPLADQPSGAAASSAGTSSAGGAEPPPSAVRARLETLKSTPNESFYDSPVFERQEAPKNAGEAGPRDGLPQRYALRLGNRAYPHMKLMIDRSPDGQGYLLRADTHDAHIQPRSGSRDTGAFAELMKINRNIADAIEAKWEQLSLPTFKKFLRDDLERRKAK
jgi:hypothetical protein